MHYFFRIFNSGAIRKTPKKVLDAVVAEINVSNSLDLDIIEVGAGNGEITAIILKKAKNTELNYHAFEIDKHCCIKLKTLFPKICVYEANALNFKNEITKPIKVDAFISSIPLSFHNKTILKTFFMNIKSSMRKNGKAVLVFSAPWLIPFLKKQLPSLKVQAFKTFPLYFVAVYQHRE
jgi:16S rRNA A1518/A1519 N6-dimethyltransferase RsmA/KsgA/DIM1 with predicted DNA glycosylase/AP lyase activity